MKSSQPVVSRPHALSFRDFFPYKKERIKPRSQISVERKVAVIAGTVTAKDLARVRSGIHSEPSDSAGPAAAL
jgi:hypothetical protein